MRGCRCVAKSAGGIAALMLVSHSVQAQSDSDLAKQLSNPVAALISVPFQFNFDAHIGQNQDGTRYLLNFQPVVPFKLNDQWNVISRTIVPIESQSNVAPNSGSQSGLGDVVQSFFLSPANPTGSGLIWGVGPAFLLPTGTDQLLGAGKWGAGPTAVLLWQANGWTYGALANHIWSFAGNGDRSRVNSTFLQPFLNYTTKDAWTFGVNTESTYDWNRHAWSTPVNATVSKLLKVGKQPVSIGGGVRYWVASPDSGPHGWGGRLVITLLFPK
ncbi:transporter [Caballeronia zhejiangensis]|uniref:transporter n=1 Tax=Caballeronia zhejiangensis TaxID=871203 RepID=UPI00158B1346|nr:transporter [Caballeronia zhejiangensis]MCG7402993.1 transporter [Caballeronia zhejiangensis]MCI1043818.1 transporter [Caballeronia zhejiangensis]